MKGRFSLNSTFVTSDEVALIKYQIDLIARPEIVKSGLQRLCGHLEAGRLLPDNSVFHTTVVGLVFSPVPVIRRWAYKALAYIGTQEHLEVLGAKMGGESDAENLTWIVSAMFALSNEKSLKEICRDSGADLTNAIILSSLLFGVNDGLALGREIPQIDIDCADPLTLKWCALLAGYGKAPSNLMHPNIENRALLSALNGHDSEEVSEYSVWAMWKADEFDISDLNIPIHDLHKKPENIRRWTNRLITSNSDFVSKNLDLFQNLYRDTSPKAREGLAIGIRDLQIPDLDRHIVNWLSRETNSDLRELILEYIALSQLGENECVAILLEEYSKAPVDGSLRKRLRAAVSGRRQLLFQKFKEVDARSLLEVSSDGLFGDEALKFGGFTMNSTTFNIGGNLNAQNVSGGNMVAFDNQKIEILKHENPDIGNILEQIVALTRDQSNLSDAQVAHISAAVNAVASQPTSTNKGKLLEALKSLSGVITIGAGAVKLPELIEKLSTLI